MPRCPARPGSAHPHPLRGQPDGRDTEEQLAVGAGAVALGLRLTTAGDPATNTDKEVPTTIPALSA